MSRASVRSDLQYARRQDADLYAWQEFWLPRYRRALRIQFYRKKFSNYAPGGATGIAGTCATYKRSRFKYIDHGQFKLHGSVPFVCAMRYARWFKLLDRETGQMVVFISAHPTPSAFSSRLSGWRKRKAVEAWSNGMEALRSFAASEAHRGAVVLIGMDANAHADRVRAALGNTLGGKRVRVRTSDVTGIDHIVIVGGGSITGYWTGTRGRTKSDHCPFEVKLRLK